MSDLTSYGAAGYSATHYYSRSFLRECVESFLAATILKMGFDYRAIHVAGTPTVNAGTYSFARFSRLDQHDRARTGAGLASMLLAIRRAVAWLRPIRYRT